MFRILPFILFVLMLGISSTTHSNGLPDFNLSPSQIETLEKGDAVSDVRKAPNGQIDVFGVIDINASPEKIWAIMKNCTQQLDIIPDLKACNILEQDQDGTWDKREQIMKLGFPLPNVRSEFRSDYTHMSRIVITRTGGDLSVLNGEWTLKQLSSGMTRVSYKARMKSRLPVPRRFIRKGVEQDMPIILANLKSVSENES